MFLEQHKKLNDLFSHVKHKANNFEILLCFNGPLKGLK